MLYLCHNRIDWRLNFDLFCTLSARAAEIGGNALPDTGRPPNGGQLTIPSDLPSNNVA